VIPVMVIPVMVIVAPGKSIDRRTVNFAVTANSLVLCLMRSVRSENERSVLPGMPKRACHRSFVNSGCFDTFQLA